MKKKHNGSFYCCESRAYAVQARELFIINKPV